MDKDLQCHNCKKEIEYSFLSKYFWEMIPGNEFSIACPYCETPLIVEVIPVPEFKVYSPDAWEKKII